MGDDDLSIDELRKRTQKGSRAVAAAEEMKSSDRRDLFDRDEEIMDRLAHRFENSNDIQLSLSDELLTELTDAYENLDQGLAGADIALNKKDHVFPLVVSLGLERLDQMDTEEILNQFEEREIL